MNRLATRSGGRTQLSGDRPPPGAVGCGCPGSERLRISLATHLRVTRTPWARSFAVFLAARRCPGVALWTSTMQRTGDKRLAAPLASKPPCQVPIGNRTASAGRKFDSYGPSAAGTTSSPRL